MQGGAVVDGVGNPNAASDPVYFAQDAAAPELALTTPETKVKGPFVVTITATEDVVGFSSDDIVITNGSAQTFTGSGRDFSITVVPTAVGDISVSVPASAVEDQSGNFNIASNIVTVNYKKLEDIDFRDYTIVSYGGSQDSGNFQIRGGGKELKIMNNAWKAINFPYTVTATTVIEFEFRSGRQGEIHGLPSIRTTRSAQIGPSNSTARKIGDT